MSQNLIKSKLRVQKHGEVFTPKHVVNRMLSIQEINEACNSLTKTFLEPSAGEGAFLVAILERKLNMVANKYSDDLEQFENYSLLALSTLYGIELLEDNAQNCTMNMFEMYYNIYNREIHKHNGCVKRKVIDSAKEIISTNISQGDFLTRKTIDGRPLVFSEWKPVNLRKNTKRIKVQRTEYTLDEIYENAKKDPGISIKHEKKYEQLNIFEFLDETDITQNTSIPLRYPVVHIVDVYKVEMEEM